jgi:hypothetical protein
VEFFALSGLVNAVAAIGLAAFIYSRSPQDPRHQTFGYFGISTAIWSFGYFFWQISETPEGAIFNLRLLMAGAIFIPVTFLHHVLYLLKAVDSHRRLITVNYWLGAIFFFSNLTPYFVSAVHPISIFPFWGVPGIAFHLCMLWWFGLVVYAHYLLVQAFLQERGLRRRQFLFLLVGSMIGYIGGATNFPLWYGIEVLPYGTVGFALYIALVAYTLMKFHWLDFSIYVEKSLSYFVLMLLISQPVYPALLLAQKSVLGTINLRYSLVQLVLHVLTVIGAFHMKVGTKGAVARTILKGREMRLQVLEQFSSKVSHSQDLRELGSNIIETIGQGVGASHAVLFIFDFDSNRFEPVASFGFTPDHPIMNKQWTITDDIPQLLLFAQNRVSVDEFLQAHEKDPWEREIALELDRLGIGWCFPLFGNGQLLGFLALGPVSAELLQLLGGKAVWNTLIHESTLALENVVLRNEVSRSHQLLRQMDRCRSLEVMTRGLSQELEAPLTSMKALVQLARLREDDVEFAKCMEQVVGRDLRAIKQLTSEIRGYVQSVSQALPSQVYVHELLDVSLTFFAAHPVFRKVLVEKSYFDGLPAITSDRQGLLQAIFNGLLFFLKDDIVGESGLSIETKANLCSSGKILVTVRFLWKIHETSPRFTLVSLEDIKKDDYNDDPSGISPFDGLAMAGRIVQQQFGVFRLLISDGRIIGFQIDLPSAPLSAEEISCLALPESSSPASFPVSPRGGTGRLS